MFSKQYILCLMAILILPNFVGLSANGEKSISGQFKSNFDNMQNISSSDHVTNTDGSLTLAGTYAKWLLWTGESPGTYWRYTNSTPSSSWYQTAFNDNSWSSGEAPFGKDYNTNLNPRTDWSTSDIWIRTSFYSRYDGSSLSTAKLRLWHDEDITIYINGVQVYSATGYADQYLEQTLSSAQKSNIKKGSNVIAATCHQTVYAQGIDIGLFACLADYVFKTGEVAGQTWKYTTSSPASDWNTQNYDDSTWASGDAPFGHDYNTNLNPRTQWTSSDIWIRRTFDFNSSFGANGGLLRYFHDEDMEVYLNGQLLFSEGGYTSSYVEIGLGSDVLSPLMEGQNVIAAHCHQTIYAQGIDIGLKLSGCEDEGNATSIAVNAPAGERFQSLNITSFAIGNSAVLVSVLDPATSTPFSAMKDLTSMDINLTALKVSSLKVRFNLKNGGQPPEVNTWIVSWEPDMPRQLQAIPDTYSFDEDTNVTHLIDIGSYFIDDLYNLSMMEFTVQYESDPVHLHAVVENHYLNFVTPTLNWYGKASFQVNCSNKFHSILSNIFNVTVISVNDPPVLGLIPHFYVPEHDSINYHFNASDVDSATDPSETLRFSIDTVFPPITSDGWMNFTAVAQNIGEHDFNITVTDRGGLCDTAPVMLTVNNTNDPPANLQILSPLNNSVIDEHANVTFNASATDEDGDALNFTWYYGNSTIIGYGQEFSISSLKPGSYSFYFDVTDGKLVVQSDPVFITIKNVNDPPTDLIILSPANGTVFDEHQSVTFQASAFDPDGDSLNVTWTDANGTIYGYGFQISISTLPPGEVQIFIIVSDGQLRESSGPVVITIRNVNDPPTGLIISSLLNHSSFYEHQPILFQALASDPDGDALNYTWKDASGNILGYGESFNLSTLHPGNYTVHFEASDGRLISMSGVSSFQVINVNDPPENARILLPANGTIFKQGDPVTFSASATDPDNDPLNYTWRDEKGNVIGHGTDFSSKKLRPGTHIIHFDVTDGKLTTTSGTVSIKITSVPTGSKGFIPGFGATLLLAGLISALFMFGRRRR